MLCSATPKQKRSPQVKIVENDAWKFNTSGKLLRNAVPLDAETADAEATKKDAWESFVKEGATELEREIAACLAPQLSNVEQWDCNSHFMEVRTSSCQCHTATNDDIKYCTVLPVVDVLDRVNVLQYWLQ